MPKKLSSLVLALVAAVLVPVAGPTAPAAAAANSIACGGGRILEPVAHRGYHPIDVDENTLEAFERAVEGGFSIETDVWQDGEGTLWFFHDRDVARATGGTGLIDEMTTAQVSALRYLKAGSPLTRFDDGMDYLDDHPTTRLYIENKSVDERPIIAQTILDSNRISTTWMTSDTDWFNFFAPAVRLLYKSYGSDPNAADVLSRGADIVALLPVSLTVARVAEFHNANIEVQGRQSNSSTEWQKTLDIGADAQLTDFPDTLKTFCAGIVSLPAVAGLSPSIGEPGTQVVITGSNLSDTTFVTFGEVDAPDFTVVSTTELVATVPAGTPASSEVRVTTAVGASISPIRFKVTPVLSLVAPAAAVPGTSVVLTGRNLAETSQVAFGGVAASFTVTGNQSVTAIVPITAPAAATITITTPGGTTTGTPFAVSSGVTTLITKAPRRWVSPGKLTFHLEASADDAAFSCVLDGKPLQCGSKLKLKHLKPGSHSLSVTSTSPTLGQDFTPVVTDFVVAVDDKAFRAESGWDVVRDKRASNNKYALARSDGATLTYRVKDATALAISVIRGPGHGRIAVFLGSTRLKVISTSGREGIKVVKIAGFKTQRSATLRITTQSDAAVAIDGLYIDN